ncbi:MAG: hypothetical protein ABSG53_17190 [Thermoguttaceae bacterium]
MSTFEDDRYRWRETYFVLFPASRRPTLKLVEKKLAALSKRYSLENLGGDTHGKFESLTLISPDDFAALDVCYTSGAEVLEHAEEMVQELAATVEPDQRALLKRIKGYDGRFDVLHFEQVANSTDEDESDELLDPSALLAVLEELARITDGIAVDPQSGTILSTEE